jgi:hypothetical protein
MPGDCVIMRNDDDTLTVTQADPWTLISAELLDELDRGTNHPAVRMDGDVLTINATNRRVVYRIDRASFDGHCYTMRWPD